tara:strand:+ start:1420 stop:2298 length:879 start_codon:yes stop_codon:yes gene_type:complete
MVILSLVFYWLFPFNTIEFYADSSSSDNFSLNVFETKNMQFYENMRYPKEEISYRISSCPLYKENQIKQAFDRLSNLTILNFYPITYNEEISATCESRGKLKEGLFIAGEGGPINITKTQNFNVITYGEILLIKESKCKNPNVAVHEILHSLGFDHSLNSKNIMYNVTKCDQTIGDDIISKINELYSVETYSDLSFENVTAVMHGKYLDTNISVRNNGLKDSENAKLLIHADEKFIKEIELNSIDLGHGLTISLKNILILKINVNELVFSINSSFNELNKKNNKIRLEIKNN